MYRRLLILLRSQVRTLRCISAKSAPLRPSSWTVRPTDGSLSPPISDFPSLPSPSLLHPPSSRLLLSLLSFIFRPRPQSQPSLSVSSPCLPASAAPRTRDNSGDTAAGMEVPTFCSQLTFDPQGHLSKPLKDPDCSAARRYSRKINLFRLNLATGRKRREEQG